MSKYACFVEAFQFLGRGEEFEDTFPSWFIDARAKGVVKKCGPTGIHISCDDYGVSFHVEPGDYIARDPDHEDLLMLFPQQEFEQAFKLVQ